MKPLPNISDEAAMLERGKRSALAQARKEATEGLRDAYTAMQGAEWAELHIHADVIGKYAERLKTLAAMWQEVA